MLPYEIVIPDPSPADPEDVATALETAAVFRSRGDGYEAMRWLRRAAESAGEAGDDERALALSRSVADLSEELDSEMTRVGAPISGQAPPISQRSPPPPPSARIAHSPSGSSQPGPPPPPLPPPPPPSSRTQQAAPSSRTQQAEPLPPPPSSHTQQAQPTPAVPATTAESLPASASVVVNAGLRNAARVAIARSTTEPGVFEVRILADNEAPRAGSTEALVVLLDPRSRLLAGR